MSAPNFVKQVVVHRGENEAVDIIELASGEILAINGEAVVKFPNLAAYYDDYTDASNFQSIDLDPMSPMPEGASRKP